MTMKQRTKRTIGLIVLAVALASILLGLVTPNTMAFTAVTTGTTHTVVIAGDEDPWGPNADFPGKPRIKFRGEVMTVETSICGDSSCSNVHATAETGGPNVWDGTWVSRATTTTTDLRGSNVYALIRVYGCSSCTWELRDTNEFAVLDGSDNVVQAFSCNLDAASITSGTANDGRPYSQRTCGPVAVPNTGTYAKTALYRQLAHNLTTTNPTLGDATYSGSLAMQQESSLQTITLTVGTNNLAASAGGTGRFDFELYYEVGVKPWVSGITVTTGTITATATDNNTDVGDAVKKYQWEVYRDNVLQDSKTTETNSFSYNAVPGAYKAKVRAQDTLSVWSAWVEKTWSVVGEGDSASVTEESDITSPPGEGAGSAVSESARDTGPSATPADFLKRSLRGWVHFLDSPGATLKAIFTATPVISSGAPEWLPEFLQEWLFPGGAAAAS